MNRYPILSLLLALPMLLTAQEINESMTVQGAYDPVVRKHERISPLPIPPKVSLPDVSLPLYNSGIPVEVSETLDSLGTPLNLGREPYPYRGYADIMAGSYLNTQVSAGYRILRRPATDLSLWLQHNSSSLFRANEASPYRRVYDERLGCDFGKSLRPGYLRASLSGQLGYFNYYRALSPTAAEAHIPMPGSQTLSSLLARAEWQGAEYDGFSYMARASVRNFGMRRIYEFHDDAYIPYKSSRETDVTLHLSPSYSFSNVCGISLEIEGRWLGYSRSRLATAGFYTLTPQFSFSSRSFRLQAGVRMDFTDHITSVPGFATLHAAPHLSMLLTQGPFSFALEAKGGVEPNTLAAAHELCFYSLPTQLTTTPMFTPLKTSLRIGFNSLSGVSAAIWGEWASIKNTPLEGLYPLYLFQQLPTPYTYLLTPEYADIHGFSMGGEVAFAYADILNVKGSMTYSPQRATRGSFNGIDRPRWVLAIQAAVTPIKPLSITIGYDYRGVRRLYYRPQPGQALTNLRLPDLYDLYAGAAYTFLQRYTVGLEARNILGSNAWTCPLMPQEGFQLLGRFALLF